MPAVGWRPLIDSGGPGGLRWASVVEMRVEKGSMILSQMHLIDKLATEPVAQLVLEGLLNHAAARKPKAAQMLGVLADPDGAVAKRLAAIGVTPDTSEDAPVILVDASLGPPAPQLKEGQLVEGVFDREPE